MARLIEEKGIRVYAEAARRILRKYPRASFRLVGYFEKHPRAISQREVEGWESEGLLTFVGRLEDVRPELEGCSVFCLPSYREGLPRSVLEALAVGRAIITTDAPGCRETVVPGENGWLAAPRNADSLADALEEACRRVEDLARMGARSRVLAEERFDVGAVNDAILKAMKL